LMICPQSGSRERNISTFATGTVTVSVTNVVESCGVCRQRLSW